MDRYPREGESIRMKRTKLKSARIAGWLVMIGVFAIAAATPWPGTANPPQQSGRKSTDPPTMSKGKLCQDLFMAITTRNTARVKALIGKGADANSRNGLE